MPKTNYFLFSLRKLLYIFIVWLAHLAGINVSFAQGTQTVTSSDSTQVIPLANIGPETERTLIKLREIREKAKPSAFEMEIDSLIPEKLKKVARIKQELNLEEIEKLTRTKTENLKIDINQMRLQLDDWRGFLTKKTEQVNAMKQELGVLKTKWDLTMNLQRKEVIPGLVRQRIQNNIKEVNSLNNELTALNNDLLTRQEKLTGALIFLEEVMNAISKKEQKYQEQIFTLDSPPIWQIFKIEGDTLTLGQRVKDITTRKRNSYLIFVENYRANIFYHILIFALLLILSFYMKYNVSRWSDEKKDEAIRSSLHVISKPISASLLIALLLSRLIYYEASDDVLNLFLLLLVIPIITLVPGLVQGIDRKYILYIAGIFVLIRIEDYFSDLVVIDRVLLLMLDISTIILLLDLLRKKQHLKAHSPNLSWGPIFLIMRIGILLLSISVLANGLGNTILAKIASSGSLLMIFGGTIIYTCAITLKSIVALVIQHEQVSRLNIIKNYSIEIKRQTFQIVRWAAVAYWVYVTLNGYLIFDPIYNWFEVIINKEWIEGTNITIGGFLAFFITLWIALLISRFIRFILEDEILTHFEMPRGVPGAISLMVKLILISTGFILAFGAAGIDMSKITIIVGALGVGIGFGLQNIFNNLISGLILAFERPIQTGDIIQIASLNLMGEVKEIGIRASSVRTFDGAEVIVPNGNLISNEMINWTLSDNRRRQELIVGVAYGTDINKVLELLKRVVPEQDNVLKNPGPLIIFTGFGESSLDFRVLFWTHFDNGLGTKSAVGIAIDEAFKHEGIEIPFPQRDLHLRSVNEARGLKNMSGDSGATSVEDKISRKNTGNGNDIDQ